MQFLGQNIEIKRKAFRRNMTIQLRPNQPIRVLCAYTTSEQKIMLFLQYKQNWIEKHLQKFSEKQVCSYQYAEGERYPFLGKEYEFVLRSYSKKKCYFALENENLVFYYPASVASEEILANKALIKKCLQNFYKAQASDYVLQRIQIWSHSMGLAPREVRIKNQSSRWGSCSSKGIININWRLMAAPQFVLDYLLVHELSHLRFMNHSKDFWGHVERHYPEYPTSEQWLKQNAHSLDFLL